MQRDSTGIHELREAGRRIEIGAMAFETIQITPCCAS